MPATYAGLWRVARIGVAAVAVAAALHQGNDTAAQGAAGQEARAAAELDRGQQILLDAQQLIDKNDPRGGAAKAAEALAIFQALPDSNALAILGRGNASYLLGKAYQTSRDDQRTFDYWNDAIREYQRLKGRTPRENLVVVLEALLPVLSRLGRTADALQAAGAIPGIQDELGRPAIERARSHSNFGVLLMHAGRLEQAGREMERAIALAADSSVPAPKRAEYIYNLGLIQDRQGDSAAALKSFQQALGVLEPLAGTSVQRAEILLDLANALEAERRPDEARREMERGLRLVENDTDGQTIRAKLLFNLAHDTAERLGRHEEAMAAYREVLRLTAGRNDTGEIEAVALQNIGNEFARAGKTEEAIRTYREALTKHEAVAPLAPALNTTRRDLALMLVKAGRASEALPHFVAGLAADWSRVVADLPALTSLQKGQAIGSTASWLRPIYALAFAEPAGTGGAAYDAALMTKALHSEARRLEHVVLNASESGDAAALQARYLELRRQISRRVLEQHTSGPAAADTTRLAGEARDLEMQLARNPNVFRPDAALTATRADAVKAKLRPGEVLLDYVTYSGRFAAGEWQPTANRYGVFVMDGFSGRVTAVDLGEQDSVDATITAFRQRQSAQADPVSGRLDEGNLAQAAEAVRRRLLDPALEGISSATRIYVAPDGLVGLVPFEVLPVNATATPIRYLVENSEIVYLLTGRDLARPGPAAAAPTKEVWLVGDPAYDATPERRLTAAPGPAAGLAAIPGGATERTMQVVAVESQASGSSELPANWLRLEGTRTIVAAAANAAEKAGLVPRILASDSASEENVSGIQRPRALMLATHGYFMPSMPTVSFRLSSRADKPASINDDFFDAGDPLQRSMLVLAGANQRSHTVKRYQVGGQYISEADVRQRGLTAAQMTLAERELPDGLVTAYEVLGMNLIDTEIVLLVACESGLGVTPEGQGAPGIRQAHGEGVAGLRQAFAIAGARSLVMSMWPVPLNETSLQIQTFFANWLGQGSPRYQAFRASQLAALARARQRTGGAHPFWWGGFVYAGQPGDR